MRYSVLLVLVLTIYLKIDSINASKASSVDLALETVLEFDKTVSQDFIDKLQTILNEVGRIFSQKTKKNILEKQKKNYKFSDFLKDVIIETNALNDYELVKLLDIVHYEVSLLDLEDTNLEFRRYLTKGLRNVKGNSKRIRNNLDNLLTNLRNNHGDRKDNFFLNFINSLYKRNSEHKLVNIINGFNIFRRKSQSNDELRKFIKKAIKTIISDLNITRNKRRILKTWFEGLNNQKISNINDAESKYEPFNLKSNNGHVKIISAKKYYTSSKKASRKANDKLLTKKLSHITLYPENLNIIDKRQFVTNNLNDKFDERTFVKEDKSESEIKEKTNTESEGNESTNEVERTKDVIQSNEEENGDAVTTLGTRTFKSFRQLHETKKIKTTQNMLKTKSYKTEKDSVSTSVEYFGNLYRHTSQKQNNGLKNKASIDFISKITKIYNNTTDINRRANDRFEIEIKKITSKIPITNIVNKVSTNILTNNSKVNSYESTHILNIKPNNISDNIINENIINKNNITYFNTLTTSPITKSIEINKNKAEDKNQTSFYTTTSYLNINNYTKNSEIQDTKDIERRKEIKRKMNKDSRDIAKTQSSFNTTTLSFDINNYLKNSEIQDIKDIEKKKEIERKMKEDLNNLFSAPTTSASGASTDAYTDIFKDLEDEFDLS